MPISDSINRMIESALRETTWTSANPNWTNVIKVLGELEHPNLDDEIRAIVLEEISLNEEAALKDPDVPDGAGGTTTTPDLQREVGKVSESLKNLKESPFGELASLTRSQTSVLQSFSKDPFQFLLTNFFKRFAKGAGVLLLATAIFAAVQFIIAELMKPGRFLDRRFKRVARDEILLFNSTEEQAELRQGFRSVTITTMPFLRGAELRGQISGNLYNPTAIPMTRIDPRRNLPPIIETQSSSRGSKFFNRRGGRR